MAHVIPYMVGGYAVDRMMGGDGMKGALLGSGFGNFGGFGALTEAMGAGNLAATGFNTGTALGSGGMNTIQGMNALGMNSAVNAGLGGLTTSIPETVSDSMLQNYDMGMGGVQSKLNVFTPTETALNIAEYGPLTELTEAERNINTFGPLTGPQSNGYVPPLPTQNDLETAANIKQYGGLEAPVPEQSEMFDGGLLNYLGEFVPDEKDMGGLALGMGIDALTPEQQERLRHQNAMISRGQTGNLLGQGGYKGIGGQYISRA